MSRCCTRCTWTRRCRGIKAVQTLSRLNRAHPKKHDVFVLDFQNDTETIEKSFADYYRTTILSKETDPNKLHTLKGELDTYQVYSPEQVDALGGAVSRTAPTADKLDPILDACVAVYVNDLDEDGQVDFKGKAKAFTRTYDFLATILPYGVQEWEKLSIFLNFLIPKLPAPDRRGPRQRASSKPSTWTATAPRRRRRWPSRCPTRTRRSSLCPRPAAGASPSRRWTSSRTS